MTSRTIDIPIELLPRVDEHSVEIAADEDAVWEALLHVLEHSFAGGSSIRTAKALGCGETEKQGEVGTIGSTLPGFVVARSVRPATLALEGEHRFSRYALVFCIDRTGSGSRLRAETRAEFPGRKGRAYRALVIGSRGHVVAVTPDLDGGQAPRHGRELRLSVRCRARSAGPAEKLGVGLLRGLELGRVIELELRRRLGLRSRHLQQGVHRLSR